MAVGVPSLSEQMRARKSVGPRWKLLAYLAPASVFYAIFLLVPYGLILEMSFFSYSSTKLYLPGFTLQNYVDVLTDSFYVALIARSIGLGILVTAVCIVLGFPLALKIAKSGPTMKSALIAVTLSPLLINLVVRSYAWIVLLGDTGVVNNWLKAIGVIEAPLPLSGNTFSVVVGLVHISLPLMTLSLIGVLERIDNSLVDAAESLGASRARVLWKVILPLTVPGIAAGSLLVFSLVVSAFVTPVILGGSRVSTISTVIYEKFTSSVNWPVGATLVMVLLVINFAVMAIHARVFKEQ